jgi:two-component system, chemotaxis family, response regulator Rcp1
MTVSSRYILLAEDNPADVFLVREALEGRAVNYDLHVIADGEQVVQFIERIDADRALHCPHLVLLDLHLPKRDGGEILKSLRASERCGQTPVVMLTASESPHSEMNAEVNAARHAALHYFRKTASLEQFMRLGDVVNGIIGPAGKRTPW